MKAGTDKITHKDRQSHKQSLKQSNPQPSQRAGPSGPDAAELRGRLRGLTPAQAEMMRQVMRLQAQGDAMMAAQWLLQLVREAPDHPEVRLWQGWRHWQAKEWPLAVQQLLPVVAARPADFKAWGLLGSAQAHDGQTAEAQHSLQQAEASARSAADWLQLSLEADALGLYEVAMRAIEGHLRLAPTSPVGRLQRARVAKALGQAELAAADARSLVAQNQELPRAWFTLLDLKTVRLDEAERAALQRTAADTRWTSAERLLLDFALGKALEDAGEHAQALQALQRANAAVRVGTPFDGQALTRQMVALRAAWAHATEASASPTASATAAQGSELIFLVGLPRSGSTLVEQVLAAHSSVEAASELPYLGQVLRAESSRRGCELANWAGQATADDWARLGQDYLRASAPWRRRRPVSTDKLPDNWMYIGALRAMLPQARIIDCRRDVLETCWSCYKQLFAPGLAAFSYDFDSLAQYAALCMAETDFWAAHAPATVRIQHYEALVARPEVQIRELLDFCSLPFEPGCLDFQQATRAIRTPSALQVRQPMRQTSTPAAAYSRLLDPLRDALRRRELISPPHPAGPGSVTAPASRDPSL